MLFFKTDTTTKATPLFKFNSSQPLRQAQKLPGLNFEYNKLVKPKVTYTMPIEKPKGTYKMPNYFTESEVKRSLVVIETE